MARKNDVVMRISFDGKMFSIKTLVEKRTKIYGFGTFLQDPKPGEISINKAAYDLLAHCPARRGLMAIEIFNGPIVSYGDTSLEFTEIPLSAISVQPGAWKELAELAIIEG